MFETLDSLAIESTSPLSAPYSIFIHIEDETTADHSLYQTLSHLSASSELAVVSEASNINNLLDDVLSRIYKRRHMSWILEKRLQNVQQNEETISQNVHNIIENALEIVESAMETCVKVTNLLSKFFRQICDPNGVYSDVVLSQVCNIFYKSIAIDEILKKKTSIKLDLNNLQKYLNKKSTTMLNNRIKTAIEWLAMHDNFGRAMQKELSSLSDMPKVANVVWTAISKMLKERSYCQSNLIYAYFTTLIFFVYSFPEPFTLIVGAPSGIKELVESIPYVPLYHELSLGSFEKISKLSMFQGQPFEPKTTIPCNVLPSLRKEFEEISMKISSFLTRKSSSVNKELLDAVVRAIRLLTYTRSLLRQQYCEKLANPPKEPENLQPYERSMRYGYKEDDLSALLQLLSQCRDLHDLLRSNTPFIFESINLSISTAWQEFIKYTLAKCYIKMTRDKDKLAVILESLRSIGTHYEPSEKWSMKEKGMKEEAFNGKIDEKLFAPSPQLIEFVRIQLHHIVCPISEFMRQGRAFTSATALKQKQIESINNFLNQSFEWAELLSFDQMLEQAVLQSDFYFKEVELEVNNTIHFSPTASMPWRLCNFALNNYKQPELTELIFYPLAIYDDALYTATKMHKSDLMADEIRSEGQVCTDTLNAIIATFTFNAFRAFSTLRQFPDKMTAYVADNLKGDTTLPISKAYRLRTIIQQNRFHYLAKNISITQIIAQVVDKSMNQGVADLFDLAKKHGLTAALAISHGLEVLRDTHRLLTENGLPLLPFTSIARGAKNDSNPLTFIGDYFKNTISHLFKEIIPKYTLAINPHRFIPNKKVALRPSSSLGSSEIGKIMVIATENSLAFVTVSHFTFFVRQCSEGSLAVMMRYIESHIPKIFKNFTEAYSSIKPRLSRVKDSPYGTLPKNVFARYESAYKYLTDDKQMENLLLSLQALGNLFIALEMLDEALVIRRFSLAHALSVLKSKDEYKKGIDKLFDDNFAKSVGQITGQSSEIAVDSAGMCLRWAFQVLLKEYANEQGLFAEDSLIEGSARLPPANTMKGFASMWSIIEFVFALKECTRPGKDTGLAAYGVGVTLAGAIMALVSEQNGLVKVMSIGTKIARASASEPNDDYEPLQKFNNVYGVVKAAYDWGIAFFKPNIDIVKKLSGLKALKNE